MEKIGNENINHLFVYGLKDLCSSHKGKKERSMWDLLLSVKCGDIKAREDFLDISEKVMQPVGVPKKKVAFFVYI